MAALCCCAALLTPDNWDKSSAIGSIFSRPLEKVVAAPPVLVAVAEDTVAEDEVTL